MRTRVGLAVAVALVLGWLAAGAVAGPYAGRLGDVATNDNAAFLPADAEATRAQELVARFVDRPTVPAIVVYERTGGITEADRARVAADAARFAGIDGVVGPLAPPIPSADGRALQVVVPLDESSSLDLVPAVEGIREIVSTGSDGLTAHVTGPGGLLADLIAVFETIDVTLLLVTVAVVLVILLLVYRSPVLWIIPLLAAGMSFAAAAALVYWLADADVITLNGQAQGILTVLVFGAGTDYALLLIARYREELHRHRRTLDAMLAAWRGAAPAIAASAGTVVASLLCLLLSGLNSNRSLGPVAALGVGATALVMLTFLPALLVLGGRWIFWPRVPEFGAPQRPGRMWRRVGGLVGRRPRVVWAATSVALAALVLGLTQIGAARLGQSDQFTGRPDSVAGQEIVSRHYPGGTGSPVTIVARAATVDAVQSAARRVPGVADVRPSAGVVDGWTRLSAVLAAAPDSAEAERTVRQLRTAVSGDAVVGGFTAVNVDTADAAERDRNVIIPLVLAVIAVILGLLLRSLVAPVLLIATVVLSFAATLGLCALLFRYVFGFPGVDASFPLFAFVFLVALGIDYNIFLMTRVREESARAGPRRGVLRGLVVTGGVITSAGVVLAATFSALAVLPLVVLVELGVAVALGVLLDTVVVRSLLVPALAYDLGGRIWWPGSPGASGAPSDASAAESDGV